MASYSELAVPLYMTNADMWRAVGNHGYHFKRLTQSLGLNYIWWDRAKNVIEIWGPVTVMFHARVALKRHLLYHASIEDYLKDFYNETDLDERWMRLSDPQKRAILDDDLNMYISKKNESNM